MTTSIADLLLRLDHATAYRTPTRGDDAAGALRALGRLGSDLRQPAIPQAERDDAVRRFADACSLAAVTFPPGNGRLTDLAGVTADAIARYRDRLADQDRWTIATQLALPARRCAAAVAAGGNYRDVPQLLGVADRAAELLLVAADNPPEPTPTGLLFAPIPSLNLSNHEPPAVVAVEAVATLVWHVTGRERLTVRQLLGACVLGEAAANYIGNDRAARAYRQAVNEIGLFADQPRRSPATDDRVLRATAHGIEALGEARGNRERGPIELLEQLLPALALGCAEQMTRIRKTLVVPHGPRPLREERVAQWLQRHAFLPTERDLQPALAALEAAARCAAAGLEAAAPSDLGHRRGSITRSAS